MERNESKNYMEQEHSEDHIVAVSLEQELKSKYIDYAMSVIMGRAIPDARDGLKPVQRRILYTMLELGLYHNKPFKKCATIVGNTMAKYHPHGDASIYDALARMAQDFNMRYVLVDGQGNFGSIDGDNPAAMRYTEARLSKFGELLLEDIDKDTVDFIPNFDATTKEPIVLPSKIPNLIINGASGIAVGMSTNIPPHNLKEVGEALIYLVDNPDCSVKDLMNYIKGPDFPTGAMVLDSQSLLNVYETGHGKIKTRAHLTIEGDKIIITDIPPMISKSILIQEIAKEVENERIKGVRDIRDESNREGIRIVIELHEGVNPKVVEKQIYAYTNVEKDIYVNLLALDGKKPKLMNLKELLNIFLKHREEVIKRRTTFLLNKAKQRLHIVEGLLLALEHIDDVISIIKKSKDPKAAIVSLVESYNISEIQAKAIVDMRLSRLTILEKETLIKEAEALKKDIDEFTRILSDRKNILQIIKQEIKEIIDKYGDKRKTEITDIEGEISKSDLIIEEDILIIVDKEGYLKSVTLKDIREQRRGGRGLILNNKSQTTAILATNTTKNFFIITNIGRLYWLKGSELRLMSRYEKGKHIRQYVRMSNENEYVIKILEYDTEDLSKHSIFFLTKRGIGKLVSLKEFTHPRINGVRAVSIDPNSDELIDAMIVRSEPLIAIATKNGKLCIFKKEELHEMGRNAYGVRVIKLDNDEAIACASLDQDDYILTITSKGYGRISKLLDYRITHRGSRGVINISNLERVGSIVGISKVSSRRDEDLISVTTTHVLRTSVNEIGIKGRTAQGVKVVQLDEQEQVEKFCLYKLNS